MGTVSVQLIHLSLRGSFLTFGLYLFLSRREIDAALSDRDRALKETHELREKVGDREKSSGKSTLDFDSR